MGTPKKPKEIEMYNNGPEVFMNRGFAENIEYLFQVLRKAGWLKATRGFL